MNITINGPVTGDVGTIDKRTITADPRTTHHAPRTTTLWHIIGEPKFGATDAQALHRAGITPLTTPDATLDRIEAELLRQRQDQHVYPNLHISAHADDELGVQLGEEWIDPYTWLTLFAPTDNLNIIFFAACKSVIVADQFIGLARHVISIATPIYNSNAALATTTFWRSIKAGHEAPIAYEIMRNSVPTLAPYFRLRTTP